MYRIICNMPGMGNLLRCRDLPSFCRPGTEGNLSMDWVWFQTKQSLAADAVILNTFEDLFSPDTSSLSQTLHHHLNVRKSAAKGNDIPLFKNSLKGR